MRKARKPAGYMSAASLDPAVAAALACPHRIVRDIAARFAQYGSISPKQAALCVKLAAEHDKRVVERQALAATGVAVPTGRVTVVGEVVAFKENQWGLHWIVKADAGWKLWSKVPAAVVSKAVRGDRVSFMAACSPSPDDPTFGFGKRPAQAVILPTPARAVAGAIAALGAMSCAMTAAAAAKRHAEATAVAGAVHAMGRYAARDALAVNAGIYALGRYVADLYETHCGSGSCHGGWIWHFSSEYPCGECARRSKRLNAHMARLAATKEVA